MTLESQYNQRQLALLLKVIRTTLSGPIDYDSLEEATVRTNALLRVLESPDPEWFDIATYQWGILEQIYAGLLFEGRKILDEQEVRYISNFLKELERLVTERLKENEAESDWPNATGSEFNF